MVIHRWYFHSPFRGIMTKNNPINRSKLGPKRHILTDKEGIPLSVVIFSAVLDIELVVEVIDYSVLKRRLSSYGPKNERRRL